MRQQHHNLFFLIVSALIMSACASTPPMTRQQGEATRNLGEAYIADGNFAFALRELLKAEKMIPGDAFVQNDLGLVYMARKRYDLAIRHFNNAVELNPDFIPAMNNLGTAYLAKEQWDPAIRIFKQLSGNLLYATPHFPLTNLGWAYYNKAQYQQAEKYYREALAIEPKFIIAIKGLANICLVTGRVSEAIELLEKSTHLSPQLPDLYLDLGKAYEQNNDIKKAIWAYRKSYELNPDTPVGTSAAERLRRLIP